MTQYLPIGLMIICLTILIFLFRELVRPAPGVVNGSISVESGSTLAGATVTASNSAGSTVDISLSDDTGKYQFIPLTYGTYTIEAIKKNADGTLYEGKATVELNSPILVVDLTLVKIEVSLETKEDSEKRECYLFCPGMFSSCFETKCAYYYRFY